MLTLLLVLDIQMSMRTWQNNNPVAVVVLAAAAAAVILVSIQTWLFPLLSLFFFSLFSLLASLAAARSGKMQTLLQLFL